MSQLMESDVYQWLRTRNSVSDLIHNFSVMCLKTDMSAILSGQPDAPTGGLFDRAKLFTQTRDNQGLTLLDMQREEMVAVNVPLSGLDELQAQAQEHMAAPSHIPLVKLLGITPTGLNASSEGEIKVFYDFVRACQQTLFADHLNTCLQVMQLHLFGEIDDAIGFEFVGLTAPTVKELAEIRKSDAETAASYIDKGVVSPDEVRARLASDPDSGYDNLSGDAPEPPELGTMETEHALGEEAAGAAHERSEESAEATHERTMKETKLAAAGKAK
jgi:phage-related protein (TIGR01555 family)